MIFTHSSKQFSESEWEYSQYIKDYQSVYFRQQDEYYKSLIMKSTVMKSAVVFVKWSKLKQNYSSENFSWWIYK